MLDYGKTTSEEHGVLKRQLLQGFGNGSKLTLRNHTDLLELPHKDDMEVEEDKNTQKHFNWNIGDLDLATNQIFGLRIRIIVGTR